MNDLLTASEVAAKLGISTRKVYALAATGELASLRIGSSVRFDPEDLNAYKATCRSPAITRAAEDQPAEPAESAPPAAFVAFFGLDRPKVERDPVPEPTPSEIRKQRREAQRQRDIARRSLVTFHSNKRRSAKLQRTPPWADLDAMRAIYDEAQRLTATTGIPHHVDHEIPLQGEFVSGLHVPNNLQILTGSENSKKHNRYEVEA